jgi:hypothetical protein
MKNLNTKNAYVIHLDDIQVIPMTKVKEEQCLLFIRKTTDRMRGRIGFLSFEKQIDVISKVVRDEFEHEKLQISDSYLVNEVRECLTKLEALDFA